jgi:hypothetical protein
MNHAKDVGMRYDWRLSALSNHLHPAAREPVRLCYGYGRRVSATAVKLEAVGAKGKDRRSVEARSLFCSRPVRESVSPMSSLKRKVRISIPRVSESIIRGRQITEAEECRLLEG